jgi:tyrosyl-tRNA synthetase
MALKPGIPTPREQAEILLQGVADEVPRKGLLEKLELAHRENRPLLVKYGADPSAPHLHLGHTVPLRKLRQFQDFGHTVHFLIGDFTAMIGDPSGRSSTRPALTREEVLANAQTYEEQVWKVLDRDRTRIVFNSKWCSELRFDEVIRLASGYTVSRILERNDFMTRYKEGKPIGLHEFLYPIVQGYDSVVLKSDVEMCGTDQIFNCHVARALQENAGQMPEVIIALPLLEGTDGVNKMSKSMGNSIGITEAPGEAYGKILSIPDTLTAKYWSLLLGETPDPSLSPRDSKHLLARGIIAKYHGEDAAKDAATRFEKMFVLHEVPDDAPEAVLPPDAFKEGRIWAQKLLTLAKAAPSRGEAERLLQQGAVELDGVRVSDPRADLAVRDGAVLKVGKRRFIRLRLGR